MKEIDELVEAARAGDFERVKALLSNHSQLASFRDASGATALHYAALGGHRRIAEFLIESGADINARDGEFGATPAGWAIEYLRETGGFLSIELMIWHMPSTEVTLTGWLDFCAASPRFGEPRIETELPLRQSLAKAGIPRSSDCLKQEKRELFGGDFHS
jgi:hypothetical protein